MREGEGKVVRTRKREKMGMRLSEGEKEGGDEEREEGREG